MSQHNARSHTTILIAPLSNKLSTTFFSMGESPTSYIIHHTSRITHHTSYITHHTSYIIHTYIIHHTSYITHHTYIHTYIHHTSYIIHTYIHTYLCDRKPLQQTVFRGVFCFLLLSAWERWFSRVQREIDFFWLLSLPSS